jgi:hypothetical protein
MRYDNSLSKSHLILAEALGSRLMRMVLSGIEKRLFSTLEA